MQARDARRIVYRPVFGARFLSSIFLTRTRRKGMPDPLFGACGCCRTPAPEPRRSPSHGSEMASGIKTKVREMARNASARPLMHSCKCPGTKTPSGCNSFPHLALADQLGLVWRASGTRPFTGLPVLGAMCIAPKSPQPSPIHQAHGSAS